MKPDLANGSVSEKALKDASSILTSAERCLADECGLFRPMIILELAHMKRQVDDDVDHGSLNREEKKLTVLRKKHNVLRRKAEEHNEAVLAYLDFLRSELRLRTKWRDFSDFESRRRSAKKVSSA